ncbi:MAG: EI24 domain-containing protein [Deltaproteobacteria bacterium]|jgi:CysZ protein|nr:EI24 domain-containing protein [Deltaproteobacteria bacterium]MBW2500972.1 EI24 domain-containing protein [Deltaproteobacteria bacterium]
MSMPSDGSPLRGVGGLREGVMLLVEGSSLLRRQRSLWPLACVPLLFTLLLMTATTVLFWSHLDAIHTFAGSWLPHLEAQAWWSWLWVGPGIALFWLIGWLAVLVGFGVALVASLLLASLASAPFLDRLSQRVEEIVLGRPGAGASDLPGILVESLRSFAAELRRLAFLAGIWLLLSGSGFLIPGAHLLTGPLLVGVTVLFLPLDYTGFALDRRQVSFGRRRRWLVDHLPIMLGFGGLAFVACLVPGLNLLLMPVMVTAGTLLVLRHMPPPPT